MLDPEIRSADAAAARGYARGTIVKVGPAYDQTTHARTRVDDWTGALATVVDVAPDGDLKLARGVLRGRDLPPADEWSAAIAYGRCEIAPCDCGHPPTFPRSEVTTGYGTDASGRTSCFACCDASERARMADPATDRIFAYWTGEGRDSRITTWPGGELGRVITVRSARVGFPDVSGRRPERFYLTVRAPDGSTWIGTSPGRGMYARLRRAK